MPVPVLKSADIDRLRQVLRQTQLGGAATVQGPALPADQTRSYVLWLTEELPAATYQEGIWTPGTVEAEAYGVDLDGTLTQIKDAAEKPIKFVATNVTDQAVAAGQFVQVTGDRYSGRLLSQPPRSGMVLFELEAPVEEESPGECDCGAGGWTAKVLWDATGMRAPETITVYDHTGCHLEGDEEDLKGALGIAVRMSRRTEDGEGSDLPAAADCSCWIVLSICPASSGSSGASSAGSGSDASEGSESEGTGSGEETGTGSGEGTGTGGTGTGGTGSDGTGGTGSGTGGTGSDGTGTGGTGTGTGGTGSGTGTGDDTGTGTGGTGTGDTGSGSGGTMSMSMTPATDSLSVTGSLSGTSSASSSAAPYPVEGCPNCEQIPSSLTVEIAAAGGPNVERYQGTISHVGEMEPPPPYSGSPSEAWVGAISTPFGSVSLRYLCGNGVLYHKCGDNSWGAIGLGRESCDPFLLYRNPVDYFWCGDFLYVLSVTVTE